MRSRAEIRECLGGLELVPPPGHLVDIVDWPAPSPDVRPTGGHAAIARLP